MRFATSLLVLLLVQLACAVPGASQEPTLPPQPTATTGPTIAYQDDFSDPNSGWQAEPFEAGERGYQDGGYRYLLNNPDWYGWEFNPSAIVFTDSIIEVDATKTSGPDENEHGLICRLNYDASTFYAGLIRSDGSYGIYNVTADTIDLVGMATEGTSQFINRGDVFNHIRFDCVGTTLTLYANGQQLAQVTDSTYTSGETGLYVGTFETGGVEILFDNFMIYRP
jgi:hypothetical protein